MSIEWGCKMIIIIQQFGGGVLITWNGWENLTKNGVLQPLSNPSNYLRGRVCTKSYFNSLSANPTKWPNILKQFVGKLSTNCLSVFNRFVGLAYKVQFLYLLYIPFILYRKKTMLNLKTLKNLIKWTFFEVSGSKVAFANFSSAKTSPYKWYFWNYSK